MIIRSITEASSLLQQLINVVMQNSLELFQTIGIMFLIQRCNILSIILVCNVFFGNKIAKLALGWIACIDFEMGSTKKPFTFHLAHRIYFPSNPVTTVLFT